MKKITKLLMIISFMFIGINGARADVKFGDNGTFDGTCTLIESSNSPFNCVYKCSITNETSYLQFRWHVFLDSGNISQELLDDTVETNEESFFGYNGVVSSGKPGEGGLKNVLLASIVSYPKNYEYIVGEQSTCVPLRTKTNLNISLGTGDDGRSMRHTYENQISIYTDLSSFSDKTKEEIDTSCGLLGSETSKIVTFLSKMFNYVKVIIPILIILLSIADFLKVIFSGKDDDMKKAMDKFIKRIIIAVVFILVPLFISIIINISGVTSQYSQVSDGLKAIFCVLK